MTSIRAENETRTRDPNLGKVVLYQLSYFRIMSCNRSRRAVLLGEDCECKGSAKFLFCKFFRRKITKYRVFYPQPSTAAAPTLRVSP